VLVGVGTDSLAESSVLVGRGLFRYEFEPIPDFVHPVRKNVKNIIMVNKGFFFVDFMVILYSYVLVS
jgi:hypothetical protein